MAEVWRRSVRETAECARRLVDERKVQRTRERALRQSKHCSTRKQVDEATAKLGELHALLCNNSNKENKTTVGKTTALLVPLGVSNSQNARFVAEVVLNMYLCTIKLWNANTAEVDAAAQVTFRYKPTHEANANTHTLEHCRTVCHGGAQGIGRALAHTAAQCGRDQGCVPGGALCRLHWAHALQQHTYALPNIEKDGLLNVLAPFRRSAAGRNAVGLGAAPRIAGAVPPSSGKGGQGPGGAVANRGTVPAAAARTGAGCSGRCNGLCAAASASQSGGVAAGPWRRQGAGNVNVARVYSSQVHVEEGRQPRRTAGRTRRITKSGPDRVCCGNVHCRRRGSCQHNGRVHLKYAMPRNEN